MRHLRKFLVLALAIILSACGKNDLIFQIEFDAVDGLKGGDLLMHGENIIGNVEDIQYSDKGNFLIDVNLQEQFRPLATHSALFYISDSHGSESKVLELVESSSEDNSPIQEDQIIKGSNKVSGMTQKLQNQFGDALQSFSYSLQNSWIDWKEQTLDQQIAHLEKELDRILVELEGLTTSAREKLETTVIPQINKQINALKEKLEELGRESELDDIEKKLDDINELIEV